MFASAASVVLDAVERLFPLVPALPREQVGSDWQPPAVYYFLDDPSPRIKQRVLAILKFDRNAVSFWRKRQIHRRVRGLLAKLNLAK